MAKITRIKAKDPGNSAKGVDTSAENTHKTIVKASGKANQKKADTVPTSTEKAVKRAKKAEKTSKPFILIRPFVTFGRYLHASWLEIRQVRWPSRKATWKMVAAIFVYTGLFIAIIMLLDALFTWLFGLILG